MVKEVFAYLHSHWDREWYKSFEEYRFRLIDVMEDIFQKLENGEISSFYLDGQTIALDDYLEIYPEKIDYIKNLIKNKKLFVGPFYALADECLVNGESLARNLIIGINEAKSYNAEDFVGYLPDAFGHCAYMPMLFKKCGIEEAIAWRGIGTAEQEFYWESPDGSKIKTANLAAGYFQDYFAQKSYKKNINNLLKNLEPLAKEIPILLPIGADHLACEDNIKAKFKNFNRDNKDFKIKLSSLKKYFEATKNNSDLNIKFGELRDNSKNCILPSVFSSRVYLKQHNAYSQWILGKISEPLFAILSAQNLLKSKQNSFDYAWKTLIQNHAHDSICGCSIDEVHRENIIRFEKIEQLCISAIELAKFHLAKKIAKNEYFAMNLSNFDFKGVYSFYSSKKLDLPVVNKKKLFPNEISYDIHNIPVQENYRYYYEYLAYAENISALNIGKTEPKSVKSDLIITEKSLENEILKVEINQDGSLNIKNKLTGQEFKNLHKITDEADVGDSYNFAPIINDKKLTAKFTNAKVIEDNTLRAKLRLNYILKIPSHAISKDKRSKKLLKHDFFVDISLSANSPRLDFEINYENLSKDHILKLNFNLPKNITKTTSEDVFGVIERKFDPEYDYKKLLNPARGAEIDLNTAPFQRFVETQGLCVLTKGLQEYEINKNELNITLLRAFGIIAKWALSTRNTAAGPPLPTPEGQCLGSQKAQYALLLTTDSTEMFKQADYFYNPLVIIEGQAKKTTIKKLPNVDLGENLYLHSTKESKNKNGLIVKVFNYTTKTQSIKITDYKTIYETNLLEEIITTENLSNKKIIFKPNELKILFIK